MRQEALGHAKLACQRSINTAVMSTHTAHALQGAWALCPEASPALRHTLAGLHPERHTRPHGCVFTESSSRQLRPHLLPSYLAWLCQHQCPPSLHLESAQRRPLPPAYLFGLAVREAVCLCVRFKTLWMHTSPSDMTSLTKAKPSIGYACVQRKLSQCRLWPPACKF